MFCIPMATKYNVPLKRGLIMAHSPPSTLLQWNWVTVYVQRERGGGLLYRDNVCATVTPVWFGHVH